VALDTPSLGARNNALADPVQVHADFVSRRPMGRLSSRLRRGCHRLRVFGGRWQVDSDEKNLRKGKQ